MENIPDDIDFNEIFKIMMTAMKLNKCHPEIPRDLKWVCQFLVVHSIFFLVFCILIYSTIVFEINSGNLTQACANGIISIIFCVVTLNYCVMLRYQSILKALIDEMKTDYTIAKSFSPSEKRIIYNYAIRGRKVVHLWFILAICASGLFVLKSFCLMIYYAIIGEFRLVPLYELTYPSPVEEMKNDIGVYLTLYGMFLIYDGYAMIMYIAMPPLCPIFLLHCCGQLEIVKRRLMNIFNENDTEETLLKKLRAIVIHLQNIYSFMERVQKSFTILFELTLNATSIILPIAFFQIIQSYHDGDFRIEFVTIIIGGITLSNIPCYYSDQLIEMGESIRLAVYMCGWETNLHKYKRLRTTLLLIHARAARAVAVRTIFRTISLDTLTDVYHKAYAIFNFLNAASH